MCSSPEKLLMVSNLSPSRIGKWVKNKRNDSTSPMSLFLINKGLLPFSYSWEIRENTEGESSC